MYNRRPYFYSDLHAGRGGTNCDRYPYTVDSNFNGYAYQRVARSYCHTHGRTYVG